MRLRTADISVIFVSRGTKRRCGACVHAATHTNNEISLPQDNTVMHAWSDSGAPTARSAESYTPNNCYRGKLHVPCVPLRNSAVTLLSLARKPLHGLRIVRESSFFFYNEYSTRYSAGDSKLSVITAIRLIINANEIESSRESWVARSTRVIGNAICMHYRSRTNANLLRTMYLDELHARDNNRAQSSIVRSASVLPQFALSR